MRASLFLIAVLAACASAPPPPPETPAPRATTHNGYPRNFGSDALDQRAERALPRGRWTERWTTPLDAPAQYLVQQGSRIVVVEKTGAWLFASDGGAVLGHASIVGSPFLDSGHGTFYVVAGSHLGAYSLADASPLFHTLLPITGEDSWPHQVFVRNGEIVVDFGLHGHRQLPEHRRHPIPNAIATVFIGAPRVIDPSNEILMSATGRRFEEMEEGLAVAAMSGDTVTIALEGHLQRRDLDLHLLNDRPGSFSPLAMSLDEDGRVYLIAVVEGARRLSIFDADSPRVSSVLLPPEQTWLPPVIGYDHRAFVVGASVVTAVDANVIAWTRTLDAMPIGAIVTTDGRLVVATGSRLVAFDAAGVPTNLFTFAGEQLRTVPILTLDGSLLVATDRALHCLRVE